MSATLFLLPSLSLSAPVCCPLAEHKNIKLALATTLMDHANSAINRLSTGAISRVSLARPHSCSERHPTPCACFDNHVIVWMFNGCHYSADMCCSLVSLGHFALSLSLFPHTSFLSLSFSALLSTFVTSCPALSLGCSRGYG